MHIILSTGRKYWTGIYKCTGDGCSAKGCYSCLYISEFDLIINTGGHYGNGNTGLYLTFVCPVCSVETDILRSDVPDDVYENIKSSHHGRIKTRRGRR